MARKSLVWETKEPYLYVRTDGDRIIAGGEDEQYNDATARKFQLPAKSRKLEKKMRRLFPGVDFRTEMAWAGTFSSTRDGLPLIGPAAGDDRMLYALGYGGNGDNVQPNGRTYPDRDGADRGRPCGEHLLPRPSLPK